MNIRCSLFGSLLLLYSHLHYVQPLFVTAHKHCGGRRDGEGGGERGYLLGKAPGSGSVLYASSSYGSLRLSLVVEGAGEAHLASIVFVSERIGICVFGKGIYR